MIFENMKEAADYFSFLQYGFENGYDKKIEYMKDEPFAIAIIFESEAGSRINLESANEMLHEAKSNINSRINN